MKFDTIVLASANRGKIAELAPELKKLGFKLLGLDDFPYIGEIPETGATFRENAIIKAKAVCKATGLPAIADDSGIMVAALGGEPGIHSARYADDWAALPGESRDARNIRKLLKNLEDVPEAARGCKFATCIAAVKPDGGIILSEGEWPGRVLFEPKGHNGFGYDPIFWDEEIGKAAAELSREEKTLRSHRGKALRKLLQQLPDFLAD